MKLQINNKQIDFFNKIKLTLKYASVGSTFSFSTYFDPLNTKQRNLFKPYTYQTVKISDDNNDRLLTGTILSNGFNDSSIKNLVSLGGYSLPGVLEDCRIPIELYPLQSDGKTLKEITQALLKPFNLNLVISRSVADAANEVYETITANQKQSIKAYLDELASQKNIIISHTDGGSLLFTRAKTNINPVARFVGGMTNVQMGLSTDGQGMHSEITLLNQIGLDDDNAGEESIRNPFVSKFRPTTKEQTSGNDIDTAQAVRNALASELKNIVLTIETDRWTWDDEGKEIMKPNNIITVHNHDIHLYRFTRFFVEQVTLSGDNEKETAILKCVIPEVYNSEIPQNIFTLPNPHD